MTASELIVACCSLGIRLTSEDGRLAVSDPGCVMTDAFKAHIKANEVELERMVRTQPSEEMAAMVRDDGDAYHQARGSFLHHHQNRGTWNGRVLVIALILASGLAVVAYFIGAAFIQRGH